MHLEQRELRPRRLHIVFGCLFGHALAVLGATTNDNVRERLFFAADCGRAQEVREILTSRSADLRDEDRYVALLRAAIGGNSGIVMQLLQAGANPNRNRKDDIAPLWLCVRTAEMARMLLGGGADPNLKEPSHGRTALHFAADAGYAEVVEVLLRAGADTNSEDDVGNKPLYYAAEKDHESVGRVLGKHTVLLPRAAEKVLIYEESLRQQLFHASTGTTYFVALDGQDPSAEFLTRVGKRLGRTLRKQSEIADQLTADGGRYNTAAFRDPESGEEVGYTSIEITNWLSDTEAEIQCTTWRSTWTFLETGARARKRFGEWFLLRIGARWMGP